MKVFISHSWKNKTQGQKITDELKVAGVDLWLDANNLLPGQLIQESIDEVFDVRKARLISLETAMIHHPVY